MCRNPLIFAFLSAVHLLATSESRGQQAASVAVTIEVHDPTGAAIPGAKIRLEPPPQPLPEKMETDQTGSLQLRLLNGTYTMFVTAQGFAPASKPLNVAGAPMAAADKQVFEVMLQVGHSSGPVVVPSSATLVLNNIPYNATISYSPAEFRALPHISIVVHNGHSNSDETYSGVPLATLLAQIHVPLGRELHGEPLGNYVLAGGADGYFVLLSLAEVDPSFHSGKVLVADALNGKPLGDYGPFQLIVSEDKRPARWVHNLTSVTLQRVH